MTLIEKINNLKLNSELPDRVTQEFYGDNDQVQYDLLGKHLIELSDEQLKLAAYDLPLFNDEAFRFYIFEFIELVITEKNIFCEDAFIQSFFRSMILDETKIRYAQFEFDEVDVIIGFLNYAMNEIEIKGDETLFDDWKEEILESIQFWRNHSEIN